MTIKSGIAIIAIFGMVFAIAILLGMQIVNFTHDANPAVSSNNPPISQPTATETKSPVFQEPTVNCVYLNATNTSTNISTTLILANVIIPIEYYDPMKFQYTYKVTGMPEKEIPDQIDKGEQRFGILTVSSNSSDGDYVSLIATELTSGNKTILAYNKCGDK